jgi:hypothetical protein
MSRSYKKNLIYKKPGRKIKKRIANSMFRSDKTFSVSGGGYKKRTCWYDRERWWHSGYYYGFCPPEWVVERLRNSRDGFSERAFYKRASK